MKVINERLITNAEAKVILEKLGKPDDLKYEQKNALSVLKKFVKIDEKKVKEIMERLRKVKKIRERQIVSIINLMPQDREDLRNVLHKEYSNFTDDEINLILETVKTKPKKTS